MKNIQCVITLLYVKKEFLLGESDGCTYVYLKIVPVLIKRLWLLSNCGMVCVA